MGCVRHQGCGRQFHMFLIRNDSFGSFRQHPRGRQMMGAGWTRLKHRGGGTGTQRRSRTVLCDGQQCPLPFGESGGDVGVVVSTML